VKRATTINHHVIKVKKIDLGNILHNLLSYLFQSLCNNEDYSEFLLLLIFTNCCSHGNIVIKLDMKYHIHVHAALYEIYISN